MKKLLVTSILVLSLILTGCGGASGTPMQVSVISADPNDAASVVRAFFTNRSAFDIDATMRYVAGNISFDSPDASITGSAQFRTFLQERADDTYQFVEQNITATGSTVSFSYDVYQHGQSIDTLLNGEAIVENGKIVQITIE